MKRIILIFIGILDKALNLFFQRTDIIPYISLHFLIRQICRDLSKYHLQTFFRISHIFDQRLALTSIIIKQVQDQCHRNCDQYQHKFICNKINFKISDFQKMHSDQCIYRNRRSPSKHLCDNNHKKHINTICHPF